MLRVKSIRNIPVGLDRDPKAVRIRNRVPSRTHDPDPDPMIHVRLGQLTREDRQSSVRVAVATVRRDRADATTTAATSTEAATEIVIETVIAATEIVTDIHAKTPSTLLHPLTARGEAEAAATDLRTS